MVGRAVRILERWQQGRQSRTPILVMVPTIPLGRLTYLLSFRTNSETASISKVTTIVVSQLMDAHIWGLLAQTLVKLELLQSPWIVKADL
jgi:hypothetical protein